MTIRFSIAMATYNGAQHLRAQLDSIAAQTHLPVELQIGDDGSTDATAQIVADFARSAPFPVLFTSNPSNLGYGENFLQAASRCRGDWIAFCDQDDVWLPHKLARCAEAIERLGREDLLSVVHAADVVSGDLHPLGQVLPANPSTRLIEPLGHHLLWAHYGFAQLFRRELLTALALTPRFPTHFTDIDRYPHDVWVSGLSNVLGATLHLSDRLVLYRRHDSSVTQTGKTREGFSVADVIGTGANHYAHLAGICRESAECLQHHAAQVGRADWTRRLDKGASAFRALAVAHEQRADLYASTTIVKRLARLGRLVGSGAYNRLGASSLGWRSLLKDAIAVTGSLAMRGTMAARRVNR
jgi:glycosyltransferase involved in cell wall biosynthesis